MMNSLSQQFLEIVLPSMGLSPHDRIVDLGCGDGWACRSLAAALPEGLIIGLDASNDLIREARAKSLDFDNVLYIWGNAEQIPWQADFFTAALCIDALVAFADPKRSFEQIYRVLTPGGSVWILDVDEPQTSAHYPRILADAGFEKIESRALSGDGDAAAPASSARLLTARKPGDAAGDVSHDNANGKQ